MVHGETHGKLRDSQQDGQRLDCRISASMRKTTRTYDVAGWGLGSVTAAEESPDAD